MTVFGSRMGNLACSLNSIFHVSNRYICCCFLVFYVVHVHHRMWIKSNIQWVEVMSNARVKGMNWGEEGGARDRVTTWEHYEEVRKIDNFISNLNQEGTDSNLVFCSFFCWSTAALGWHHVKSERIHDDGRWWERKYEISRWRSFLSIGGDGWICAGSAEEWRGGKRWKCWKSLPQLPCLAGLGPWILVKYIISCLFQIHNGRDRFYLVS